MRTKLMLSNVALDLLGARRCTLALQRGLVVPLVLLGLAGCGGARNAGSIASAAPNNPAPEAEAAQSASPSEHAASGSERAGRSDAAATNDELSLDAPRDAGGSSGASRRDESEERGSAAASPPPSAATSGTPTTGPSGSASAAPSGGGAASGAGSGASAPAKPAPDAKREGAKDGAAEYDSDTLAVEDARPRAPASGYAPAPAPVVEAPAMQAGRHDDNKEYNRFLAFLAENLSLIPFAVDVSERLVVRTVDENGKSLPNCMVEVQGIDGRLLSKTTTYADGRTQFFPAAVGSKTDKDYKVVARCGGDTKNGQLSRAGRRETEIRFNSGRKLPQKTPVDIAILLDTTGSMGSQIDRLTKTLRAIHFQLTSLPTKPDIRFAMVAYRDRDDEYVTRVTGFTSDVAVFQKALNGLEADGGGDTPEDLQQALDKALHTLDWRADAIRLAFVVSDAVPHTDYPQAFNYREAMREGLGRGIKVVTVGAGGLGRDGEVIFRQIAQFTMAEYVFVTEGGGGDSEGGTAEASHHVGTNYKKENLDQAIVRIVRRELSYLTDTPKDFDDTIVAQATAPVKRDDVLGPAVDEALRQLCDYSSIRIASGTPIAIAPVTATDDRYKDVAGYLTDRFILAASRNPSFRVVERDLTAISQELKLQLSDLFDATETVAIGKMVGAEALVVAKLNIREGGADLFAKLVRVETGEILAVARVDIATMVLKS